MEFILQADDFLLQIIPHLNDVAWEESILEIMVKSDEFSAATEMEIECGDFLHFADKLCEIYENLKGDATIAEAYGGDMYISFEGDGRGHFLVTGYLRENRRTGGVQKLEFENEIDQTYLKNFCYWIRNSMAK